MRLEPCRYRLNEEKAEWIIYLTDVGQQQHFEMFFKVSYGSCIFLLLQDPFQHAFAVVSYSYLLTCLCFPERILRYLF